MIPARGKETRVSAVSLRKLELPMIDHPSRRRVLRTLAALSLGGVLPSAFARSDAAFKQASALSTLPCEAQGGAGVQTGSEFCSSASSNAAQARTAANELALSLAAKAPNASMLAVQLATEALERARAGKALPGGDPRVLALVDFSLPSTAKRLWVFDLNTHEVLFEEWVAHGRNTGDNFAREFSNRPESHMSSLGAYQAGEIYTGKNGYSLRLHGLEPGFNDLAFDRAIVIHGAPYVSAEMIRAHGRLGRSFGCPAVRVPIARPLIDTLAEQAFLFNFYPQRDWMEHSALIGGSHA